MEGHPTNSDDMDLIVGLFDQAMAAQIMCSATKLELFDKLSAGGLTAEDIAKDNGWDTGCLERVMNGCVALKLLSKSQGPDGKYVYDNTGAGSYLMRNSSGTSMWAMVYDMMDGMIKMTGNAYKNVIRGPSDTDGNCEHGTDEHGEHQEEGEGKKDELTLGDRGWSTDPKDTVANYKAMGSALEPMADQLVSAFDFSSYKSVVDLGGGNGVLAFAIKRRYPHMKVAIVEMKEICDVLKEYFIPQSGLKDIEVIEGDIFKIDLPRADLFLMGRIAHHFGDKEKDEIFTKLNNKTTPGGGIMIFEKVLNETKDGPLTANIWNIMRMDYGMGSDTASYWMELLKKYGFVNVQKYITQPMCQTDIIFGKKA